jgi:hypothetical protein
MGLFTESQLPAGSPPEAPPEGRRRQKNFLADKFLVTVTLYRTIFIVEARKKCQVPVFFFKVKGHVLEQGLWKRVVEER